MSVYGVVGSVGSGKTQWLADIGMKAIARGDLVFANFHFGDRQGFGYVPHGGTCGGMVNQWDRRTLGCALLREDTLGKTPCYVFWPHPAHKQNSLWLHRIDAKRAKRYGLQWSESFIATDQFEYEKVDGWEALMNIQRSRDEWGNPAKRGIVMLIDEINMWAPSRKWAEIPMDVLYQWSHNRKQGLEIWWSSQREARVDKALREVTQLAYWTVGVGPRKAPWFFWRREYVPQPDVTDPLQATPQLEGSFWSSSFMRNKKSRYRHYDTFEPIKPSAHLNKDVQRRLAVAGG